MSVNARIPAAIEWSEGELLTPQHFQELAGRYEILIQQLRSQAGPFPWGLIDFDFDEDQLVAGRCVINTVEAVMPDGLLVASGLKHGTPLELDLSAKDGPLARGSAVIHLVVPAQVALTARGGLARYRSVEGEALADANTGEGEVRIARLAPKVELLPAGQVTARYRSIPLMEVRQVGDTCAVTDFLAPWLRVAPDSRLAKLCGSITARLRERGVFLADQLRSPAFPVGQADAVEARLKLASLMAALPLMEASLATGHCHPFDVYRALCQAAGAVAWMSVGGVAPRFGRYRHDDQRASFSPLLQFIDDAVTNGVSDLWRAIPGAEVNGVFEFQHEFDAASLNQPAGETPVAALGIRVPPGASEKEMTLWGEGCRIGTASLLPTLVENRTPGVERRAVDYLPGLSAPPGTVLFALAPAADSVQAGEPLLIQENLGHGSRPRQVTLYVRMSKTGIGA